MGSVLFDEDDILLVPSPHYFFFHNDFGVRNMAKVAGVPIYDSKNPVPKLVVDRFEKKFNELKKSGRKVKALLLTNPNNPDGHYFTLDELKPIIEWAIR